MDKTNRQCKALNNLQNQIMDILIAYNKDEMFVFSVMVLLDSIELQTITLKYIMAHSFTEDSLFEFIFNYRDVKKYKELVNKN